MRSQKQAKKFETSRSQKEQPSIMCNHMQGLRAVFLVSNTEAGWTLRMSDLCRANECPIQDKNTSRMCILRDQKQQCRMYNLIIIVMIYFYRLEQPPMNPSNKKSNTVPPCSSCVAIVYCTLPRRYPEMRSWSSCKAGSERNKKLNNGNRDLDKRTSANPPTPDAKSLRT